jgi:hypothetical protein
MRRAQQTRIVITMPENERVPRLLFRTDSCKGRFNHPRRTLVKLYRFMAVSLMLMAGACLAQTSNDQPETVTENGAPQMPAVALPSATQPASFAGKTREQVMREQADFANSPKAAEMRELYRGGS